MIRKNNNISKKPSKLKFLFNRNGILWSVIFTFVVTEIYLAMHTSALGIKLQSIESITTRLSEENIKLRDQLVNSTSLSVLDEKTAILGYSKPQTILYLGDDQYVAKVP